VAISISATVLFGILAWMLLRQGHVRIGSAVVCALFGFTLASTGLAPLISSGLTSLAGLISRL
jgi:hypothetical protein